MGFTYTIETRDNFVFATAEGTIAFADLQEHMQTVISDPMFQPGMNAVADMRNAQIAMTIEDIPDLIRLFIQQAKTRKRGKWAVVMTRYPERHLLHFFITFMNHLPFKMKAFGDTGDALNWLRDSDQNRARHAR